MMVKVLLVIVGVGLIFWLNRIRKKDVFKRHHRIERSETSVSGFEIQTPLSAETPLECLRHDGLRFGESFRLKTAPPLPHNEHCQCKIVNLSYTSTEVFEGALRHHSIRETTMGTLDHKEASLLREMLKNLHPQLPNDFEEYRQRFDLDTLSREKQQQMIELVREKFDQLKGASDSKPSSPPEKIYQG